MSPSDRESLIELHNRLKTDFDTAEDFFSAELSPEVYTALRGIIHFTRTAIQLMTEYATSDNILKCQKILYLLEITPHFQQDFQQVHAIAVAKQPNLSVNVQEAVDHFLETAQKAHDAIIAVMNARVKTCDRDLLHNESEILEAIRKDMRALPDRYRDPL